MIDAEFALNEGGRGESLYDKKLSNDLQVSEKYVLNFRIEVRNKGGHSSIPVTNNAIYHLAFALAHLSEFGFPLKTNEVTAACFQQMSKIETGPIKEDLANAGSGSQGAMQKVAATAPAWNATLRTTCVATQLEGGHALNALPQLAAANVNCRVLPEDSAEYVLVTLKKVVADEQVTITPILQMASGPASPMRPDVLAAVRSTTQKIWPGVETIPIMVMGATDGRYLRAVGIPAYGIQGFFFDKTTSGFTGGMNAWRWSLFYEGQTFLYDLVKTLSGAAN